MPGEGENETEKSRDRDSEGSRPWAGSLDLGQVRGKNPEAQTNLRCCSSGIWLELFFKSEFKHGLCLPSTCSQQRLGWRWKWRWGLGMDLEELGLD